MSKVLKLSGLKSFTGPFTGGVVVQKGEVIRVTDAVAAKIEEGGRNNSEGEKIHYWVEPTASDKVNHDFTDGKEAEQEAEAVAPKRSPVRQRGTAKNTA